MRITRPGKIAFLSINRPHPELPTKRVRSALHLELWVSRRENRTALKRTLRKVYSIARPITKRHGGEGPWLYLVDHDPIKSRTTRLRTTLGVTHTEDLWVELAYYPSKAIMKKTIRYIWGKPRFNEIASSIDNLISKRRPGYEATLALARKQQV